MENTIGVRMKELRGLMSQRQAAAIVGINPQNWNVYESGQSLPGAQAILNICQQFNVSADWLLGLSDERAPVSDAAPKSRPGLIGANHSLSESGLLAEIRALKSRVSALESQSSSACG